MTGKAETPSTSGRPLALITGASSGLGEGFARRLARDGSDLVLVARREDRLRGLADELRTRHGVDVEVLCADLTDPARLALVEERIRSTDLDLLVNNAGFMTPRNFVDEHVDTWDAMVRLHALASVRLARAALPGMIRRGRGDLINVASVAAFVPMRRNILYTATKMLLVAFSEGLSQELHGTGVRVQVLCPGWTRTELVDDPLVDTSAVGWWDEVDDVVDYALKSLERGRLVCIPGWRNRWLVRLCGITWRPILRWMLRHSGTGQVRMKEE